MERKDAKDNLMLLKIIFQQNLFKQKMTCYCSGSRNLHTIGEQEQIKFDDLPRGFTEDFQRLTKYKRTLPKR